MVTASIPLTPADLLARLTGMAVPGERLIIGIAGEPGAGKSTVAGDLARLLGHRAVLVAMDGYHLANDVLRERGLLHRKGAPETFDAAGYVALMERIRQRRDDVVYAPEFRREIDEPVAGAIPIPAETEIVLTEGNYLLLDAPPWKRLRELLDEVWYVDLDADTRLTRLMERHTRFGRTREQARAHATGSDELNARLIRASMQRADLVFTITTHTKGHRT